MSGHRHRPWSVGRAVPSDAELWTRTRMLVEQIEVAQAEIVLHRAAYERATEEETADRPWLRSPVERLSIARIARALAAELAAVGRFRVWAEELHYLQEEARARGCGAAG
ncbi:MULTISPECIES: hypothetical protein [unclassified Frankia]|uniref:hypothetical protein n=1 Tax=unclassified Frankia TaxID=2632575 RepID=UPI00202463E4